ncbi:hypothetical protein ABK040_008945 [Willaertia magna]
MKRDQERVGIHSANNNNNRNKQNARRIVGSNINRVDGEELFVVEEERRQTVMTDGSSSSTRQLLRGNFSSGNKSVDWCDDNLQKQRKMIGWKGITKIGTNNNLLNDIYLFIVFILNNLVIIIKTFWTFILLALGFLLFIFYNKGLTVGDKSNHIAIFHLPQLFYFTMFICFMDPVLLLQNLINLFNYLKQQSFTKNLKYLSLFILSIGILTLLNYHFQYVHLFIKSDNRHYVFYLFRKVFKIHLNNGIIHWVNCLLVSPIYFAGFYLLIINLKEKSNLWKLCFVMCVILNICPLPLVEFRYFIIPYYFFHLQRDANNNETISHQQEYRIELLTILYYLLINTLTIYLFLNKPFIGPDHLQSRFMW